MGENDIEKSKISLKTYVVSIIVIVSWVGGLCAVYFPMQGKLNDANARVIKLETRLDKYNLDVLDYKVGQMALQLNSTDAKINDILIVLNANRSRTGR